jgi:hypothetical protein
MTSRPYALTECFDISASQIQGTKRRDSGRCDQAGGLQGSDEECFAFVSGGRVAAEEVDALGHQDREV